ncbi:hypothetical protein GlitD10_0475 [Gloeomargarita lithophora Alchichica-D10]|uniref:Uncharacterized protein n=1 Tax=Gloeomargarita lithophora Alchichica-D10 TaxID=1188229 RepID=A0A1J0AA34_9CYAN|nr:hypothetical protein [Gloeomargarita lithophora]APB32787.1 hypothetical protein GlitD10_0475 [Gloeomargarita lithophora Alchichica-D10]
MWSETGMFNRPEPEDIDATLSRLGFNPLSVIVSPSGELLAEGGGMVELQVTVTNRGNVGALIDVVIDPTSQPLRDWCAQPRQRLALSPQQSYEVIFTLHVPEQTLPGTYGYLLVVDAPEHYPEASPVQQQGHVLVQLPAQQTTPVRDPTFLVIPATDPGHPLVLTGGITAGVRVRVQNRSPRVDRFQMECEDIAADWFLVVYPEGIFTLGQVQTEPCLELNPGAEGEIELRLQAPVTALAGQYSATVRVRSTNDPGLALIEAVYLEVAPQYAVQVDWQTLRGRVRRQMGLYEISLHNQGNSPRSIGFTARTDREQPWGEFTFDPPLVALVPTQADRVSLAVQPKKGRPWWGKGAELEFAVLLQDNNDLPLEPERLAGVLIWEARPWWQLALLIALAVLGLAGLAFLLWWWLLRPPVPPRILAFTTDAASYQIANRDVVRLNWQISQPRQLTSLQIQGVSPGGEVVSQRRTYGMQGGIPRELANFCTLQRQELTCRFVPTDARAAGTYIFELVGVTRRGRELPLIRTAPVVMAPVPPKPEVVAVIQSFAPTQTLVAENLDTPTTINLNWRISQPQQAQQIRLQTLTPEGLAVNPPQTFAPDQAPKDFCRSQAQNLTCTNLPVTVPQAGLYLFELTVLQKGKPPQTQKTDLVKVNPAPTRIVDFSVNGTPAQPKYVFALKPQETVNVNLAWQVIGSPNVRVELQPTPGSVGTIGGLSYPLTAQTGSQVLTLTATNPLGEQVSRSLILEVVALPPDPRPSPDPAAAKQGRPPGTLPGETVPIGPPPKPQPHEEPPRLK